MSRDKRCQKGAGINASRIELNITVVELAGIAHVNVIHKDIKR
jgi:hypothetical protein